MIGTAAAMLGGSLISGATSLIGGLLGKSAAQKAADEQSRKAEIAGQDVIKATEGVNPGIEEAANHAGDNLGMAANNAAVNALSAGRQANEKLDPYAKSGADATGELDRNLAAGGDFNRNPTTSDITIDPGFAFRLKQANEALERSAAGRGGLLTGGTSKRLSMFNQDAASQEYANAFQRYQENLNGRFSRLKGVADSGQAAATTQGKNLIDTNEWGGALTTAATEHAGDLAVAARNKTSDNTINAYKTYGDYLTQGANAKAAGIVGGTNALTSGLSGAGSTVMNALLLSKLLANPAGAPAAAPAAPAPINTAFDLH